MKEDRQNSKEKRRQKQKEIRPFRVALIPQALQFLQLRGLQHTTETNICRSAPFVLESSSIKFGNGYTLDGRSRDRSPVVSFGIISVVPSDKTMCNEVDSASENEYQGFLLGKRRPVCLADDLPPL